jgi:hypothetical protein
MIKKILLSPWTALLTLTVVLMIRIADPGFIESVRLRYFDQLVTGQPAMDVPVHTVNIDEAALEKYGQRDQAYQKSLELSQLDPNNAAYLKLFAGLAIRSGLVEFAFQTLPRIEILTSKAEAEAFRKYLETELKAKNFPLPENIIP